MARSDRPNTVLITRFSALGDVAMTVPVVYDMCRAYPGTRFVMVTKATTAALFINPPDNLIVDGVDLRNRFKGPAGLLRLYAYLKRTYGYSSLVDLHDVTRTKVLRLLSRLTGVKVAAIDKGRCARRRLTARRPGQVREQLRSSFERYRDAFSRAGLTAPGSFTTLFDNAQPQLPVGIEPRRPGERWIAVAPFAAHNGKVYPSRLMSRVIAALADSPGTRLFVFGAGPTEREAIDLMADGRPNVVSMAARRAGFAAELSLLALCDVALTMDSGNMHLAALAGTRVISIWGQTHPCCGFYGWRQQPADAIGADMDCRPCSVFGNRPCRRGDYACLNSIDPMAVVDRIDAATGRTPNPTPQ